MTSLPSYDPALSARRSTTAKVADGFLNQSRLIRPDVRVTSDILLSDGTLIPAGAKITFQQQHINSTGAASQLGYLSELSNYWANGRPLYDHMNLNQNGMWQPSGFELPDGTRVQTTQASSAASQVVGVSGHPNGYSHPQYQAQLRDTVYADLDQRWNSLAQQPGFDRDSQAARELAADLAAETRGRQAALRELRKIGDTRN